MPPAGTPRTSLNPLAFELFSHSPQPQGQVGDGAVKTPESAKPSPPATSALLGRDVLKHAPGRPLLASSPDCLHPDTLKPTRLAVLPSVRAADTLSDMSPASGTKGNSPSPPPAARTSPNPLILDIFVHSDAAGEDSLGSGDGVAEARASSIDGFKDTKDKVAHFYRPLAS
jgi:hypothetical protein